MDWETEKDLTTMFGFNRITFDPRIMGGQACIRGMRIPVSLIVNLVAHGQLAAQIVEEYPDIQREDVQQALQYAAWLTREQVVLKKLEPVEWNSFCLVEETGVVKLVNP